MQKTTTLKQIFEEREGKTCLLSGVDTFTKASPNGYGEDVNGIRFILDDITFEAIEDKDDGYRSSMEEIFISDEEVKNKFPRVEVSVDYKNINEDRSADILTLTDKHTGEVILEVGTDNTDDYYPSYVASFMPEKMTSFATARLKEMVREAIKK